MAYHIGQVLTGTVTGIKPYGAFVQLDDTTQGLVHISEFQINYVATLERQLTLGDRLDVMILDIDPFTQKISLSCRALTERKYPVAMKEQTFVGDRYHHFWTNARSEIGFVTLEKSQAGMINESLANL